MTLSEKQRFRLVKLHNLSGQISIIPKPELRGFGGSSLIKPPFRVTSADVVKICPEFMILPQFSKLAATISH